MIFFKIKSHETDLKGYYQFYCMTVFFPKKIGQRCFPDIFELRPTFDTRSVPTDRYCISTLSRLVFIEKSVLVMDLQTLAFVDKKSAVLFPKYAKMTAIPEIRCIVFYFTVRLHIPRGRYVYRK